MIIDNDNMQMRVVVPPLSMFNDRTKQGISSNSHIRVLTSLKQDRVMDRGRGRGHTIKKFTYLILTCLRTVILGHIPPIENFSMTSHFLLLGYCVRVLLPWSSALCLCCFIGYIFELLYGMCLLKIKKQL